MSELSVVYEFEDIAWDELCMTDDHTVPGIELEKEHSLRRDDYKKLCNGVVGGQGNVRRKSSKKNGFQEKESEELVLINYRRKRVLENKVEDSDKEDNSLAPVANRKFCHNFKSNNKDTTMDSSGSEYRAVDVDSNSYSFPLSQTEKDVNFFDETHDIKDSRDSLYYGWPDIGNLEDVDRTFSNEDEFKWFASSEDVEAALEGSNPEFQFPCSDSSLVENKSKNWCEHSINETHLSISDTCMKAAPSSWLQEKDRHESLDHFSFVNGICSSDTEADFMLIEQDRKFFPEVQNETRDTVHSTDGRNDMPTHGDQSKGKQKDQYLVDEGYSKSLLGNVSKKTSKGVSPELFSCMDIKQNHQPLVRESFGHLPCNIQFTQSDYSCPSDQTSEYGVRYQTAPIIPNEKFEMLHHNEALQSTFYAKPENIDMGIQVPFCSPVSTQKKVQQHPNEFDILGDAEKVRSELDSKTLQESSSVGSASDEMSLEAASLCQLQLVAEQLDPRTKLCIRDSLYRLAQSATQRHDNKIPNQDTCRIETAIKCTEFLNMETDTNPIDRSIAHLLYHRLSVLPKATTTQTPTQESSFHHNNTATAVSF